MARWIHMRRANAVYVLVALMCAILTVLALPLYAGPPSDRCILMKVYVAGQDDNDTLANMGLDIFGFREGGLVIRVTEEEKRQVQAQGFTTEIITEDVYKHLQDKRGKYLQGRREAGLRIVAERTYHSLDEVIDELVALEASGVAQMYTIGSTHEGRDIWAVKISDNPTEDEDEPGVLFFGCQHAREWIGIEVPLDIAQHLTSSYDTDAVVKRLVDSCEIWIVPVVNPDGYEYSRVVDRMWRKNRRNNGNGTFGVDLNRNWDYMWGHGGASSGASTELYRGPGAFSEPETRAMRELILANDIRIMVDYHSYGQVVITPWTHTRDACADSLPLEALSLKIRTLMTETSGATYFRWWDWFAAYLHSGTSVDWGYGKLGIYTLGIELGPESGGFIPPESLIERICEENLPAALHVLSLAAGKGGVVNLRSGETYGSIQFAINDANDGDEIVLEPGLYQESILVRGDNITLRSVEPNDPGVVAATVIDGPVSPAMQMSGGQSAGCQINGLTIISEAVGIQSGDTSPTIRNCTIAGDGLIAVEYWRDYEPAIIDCNFVGHVVEVNDPRIIAHWRLDEVEGPTALDCIGDHDGMLEGDPVWRPDDGMIGGALELDGIDDCLVCPVALVPTRGPFSVFAWIQGGAPGQVVISQRSGANWVKADSLDGTLMTELRTNSRSPKNLNSQGVITDGKWHRVGFTWDGENRKLYMDDILVAEDVQTALGDSDGSHVIGCGKNMTPGTYWSGLIDDVRIYNRAVRP